MNFDASGMQRKEEKRVTEDREQTASDREQTASDREQTAADVEGHSLVGQTAGQTAAHTDGDEPDDVEAHSLIGQTIGQTTGQNTA
jgi:hypothetical protein